MSAFDFFFHLPRYLYISSSGMIGPNSLITAVTRRPTKSSSGSGSAFAHGLPKRSHGYSNSLRARLEFPSMASKICKDQMDHVGSRLRSRAILMACLAVIHVLIVWIFRRIKTTRVLNRNCYLLLSTSFSCAHHLHQMLMPIPERQKVSDKSSDVLHLLLLHSYPYSADWDRYNLLWTLDKSLTVSLISSAIYYY